jgi:hypothetical protein
MESRLPCDRHEEQIKTLFKKDENMEKRIEKIENDRGFMHSLDKNMTLQTQMIKEIREHNLRQDARMDKQDKRLDEQHQVIVSINENLTELTEGQRTLNNRVGKLEDKVEENDTKHTLDLRDINKEKNKNILAKYAAPFSVGLAVGTLILEIIKIFK